MYVCICHKVSDRDIASAVNAGCCSLRQLQEKTCLGTQCGNCVDLAKDLLKEYKQELQDLNQYGLPS